MDAVGGPLHEESRLVSRGILPRQNDIIYAAIAGGRQVCRRPGRGWDRVQAHVVDQGSPFASRAARTQELDRMGTGRKREIVGRQSAVAGAARLEAADPVGGDIRQPRSQCPT